MFFWKSMTGWITLLPGPWSLLFCLTSTTELGRDTVKKRDITCVKAREMKGRTCENLIIYTLEKDVHTYAQEMPFVGLFICSFSTRGKEEETGKGAGGRCGGEGGCRRFCRAGKRGERMRNRKKQRVVDRRGEREAGEPRGRTVL